MVFFPFSHRGLLRRRAEKEDMALGDHHYHPDIPAFIKRQSNLSGASDARRAPVSALEHKRICCRGRLIEEVILAQGACSAPPSQPRKKATVEIIEKGEGLHACPRSSYINEPPTERDCEEDAGFNRLMGLLHPTLTTRRLSNMYRRKISRKATSHSHILDEN